jgi:hypothetical protein
MDGGGATSEEPQDTRPTVRKNLDTLDVSAVLKRSEKRGPLDRHDEGAKEDDQESGTTVTKPIRRTVIKDWLAIFQSAVTIAGILGAGWWFIAQRETAYRANVSNEVVSYSLGNHLNLINVTATLTNKGRRRIHLGRAKIRLDQVAPLAGELAARAASGKPLIDRGNARVIWPSIGGPYRVTLNATLEPSEAQAFTFEFVIPSDVETVRLYSFFASESTSSNYGWSAATIHDVRREER